MMTEKVTAIISPLALQKCKSLFANDEKAVTSDQGIILQLLQGQTYVIRYPQKSDNTSYIGAFIQLEHHATTVQLLIEVAEQITIIDILVDSYYELEEHLALKNIEWTSEEGFEFTSSFWQAFYQLSVNEKEQEVVGKLQSWAMYIDFLLTTYSYPYTIKKVIAEKNEHYKIQFFEEDKLQQLTISGDHQLYIEYAFSIKELAYITHWQQETSQLTVHSHNDLMSFENKEVMIYNAKMRQDLLRAQGELQQLINLHQKQPNINHPLLNAYYKNNQLSRFSGLSTKAEDAQFALAQLMEKAQQDFEKLAVVTQTKETEAYIVEKFADLLPIDRMGNADQAIQTVKDSMKEKNEIKLVELENLMSKEEIDIQRRALGNFEKEIQRHTLEVNQLEDVQHYLHAEMKKNGDKVNVFSNLIMSYQEEQEQIAFQNDQLIKAKIDLEDSIKEQEELLERFAVQQQSEKEYYSELEENWLLFNKESAVYTDHIVAQKNKQKAEKIIEDCQMKIKQIKHEQALGNEVQKNMLEEFTAFTENQQLEQVENLSVKMKATAAYLDETIDLQFATSYSELTTIYMEKFQEIEFLEERFEEGNNLIKETLHKEGLQEIKVTSTQYSYDRHYAEEKMVTVLDLIERKPIALGINYKAKQRWKEQLVEAVEDLESMQLAMSNERQKLESKLMTQLRYAEQLQQYFETDLQALQGKMEQRQSQLSSSYQEYEEIIAVANKEIVEMNQNMQNGLKRTKGRSEIYGTLSELEKARKAFKIELLSKYEELETQSIEIERAHKYLEVLQQKHELKSQEVIQDKQEMNIQIDVLQHDIVNSKTAIENIQNANELMSLQNVELVNQVIKQQQIIQGYETLSEKITSNLQFKEENETQHQMILQEVRNWHNELHSTQVTTEWQELIKQKSRLRISGSIRGQENSVGEILVVEDQHFTWFEMVILLNNNDDVSFITDDIAERIVVEEVEFETYLQRQNISLLKRQEIINALKINPFKGFEEGFKIIEQPYLIIENQSEMTL